MNASSWSLRNLPWFRATLAQWRYALRNTIAMCLALTVAYYLNLDEPYWAMTSAAVVSFPPDYTGAHRNTHVSTRTVALFPAINTSELRSGQLRV